MNGPILLSSTNWTLGRLLVSLRTRRNLWARGNTTPLAILKVNLEPYNEGSLANKIKKKRGY